MHAHNAKTSDNQHGYSPAATSSTGPGLQCKLSIGAVNDPLEAEADAMAERVMRMPDTPVVQRKCAECEKEDKQLQRKPLTTQITPFIQTKASVSTASVSDAVASRIESTRGGGNPLPETARSFMESRLDTDFSGVRIHAGDDAAQLSNELNAQAFTVGNDIYFNSGKYQPDTENGRHLLAHELTHTIQQKATSPDKQRNSKSLINPFLSASDIQLQKSPNSGKTATCTSIKILLPNAMAMYGSKGVLVISIETNAIPGEGTISFNKTTKNFILSNGEKGKVFFTYTVIPSDVDLFNQYTDSISSSVPLEIKNDPNAAKLNPDINSNLVPRPSALPLSGDYKLIPIKDAPQTWVDSLPEDKIVKVVGSNTPTRSTVSPYAFSPFPGAGAGLSAGVNSTLSSFMTTGFAPIPGGNGIGLIGFPRIFSSPSALPESLSIWGHTEIYVRINGEIIAVRGYTVESMLDALRKIKSVPAGKAGIPATISSTPGMFTNTTARTIEYPVSEEIARKFLSQLPEAGKPPASGPIEYTGRPAVYGKGSNCVTWACSQVESALEGKVGTTKLGPIAEPVNPAEGLQGRFMKGTGANAGEVLPMAEATGEAVVSSVPRSLQVLKWGGRVFIVIGAGLVVYEIVEAPKEQQERTAVGAISGFAGGIVAGAAAGLACGPGALACSIILGIGFGLVGAFAARNAAEGIYDDVKNPKDTKLGPRINVAPDGTWLDAEGRMHMGPGPKW